MLGEVVLGVGLRGEVRDILHLYPLYLNDKNVYGHSGARDNIVDQLLDIPENNEAYISVLLPEICEN